MQKKYIINIAIFAFTFLVTSFVLSEKIEKPYVQWWSEKELLAEKKISDANIIFIGSSTVFRQISPRIFDEELRLRGVNSTSLNLGVPAMNGWEAMHLLQYVKSFKNKKVEFVILDLYQRDGRYANKWRDHKWHNLENTLEYLMFSNSPDSMRYHINSFILNSVNLGGGAEQLHSSQNIDSKYWGPDQDGWYSLDDEALTKPELYLRNITGERIERYNNKLSSGIKKDYLWADNNKESEHILKRLLILVKQIGATPIFIIPPIFSLPDLEIIKRHHVLAYNSPTLYPQLFSLSHRFDQDHLNKKGSVRYTKIIANDVCSIIECKQP